eukprot:9471385-Pyramimonas_sp.AAC.1
MPRHCAACAILHSSARSPRSRCHARTTPRSTSLGRTQHVCFFSPQVDHEARGPVGECELGKAFRQNYADVARDNALVISEDQ